MKPVLFSLASPRVVISCKAVYPCRSRISYSPSSSTKSHINLLLYAYDSDSPFHAKAAAWWRKCLSGTEPVGLPVVVAFGFLRVATSARAFRNPMSSAEVAGCLRSWLAQPIVRIVEPGIDHVGQVLRLLEALRTAGNLVTDAQIAALAMEQDAVLHTADADFQRFPGLRWLNPLTGIASGRLRRKHSG